MIIDDRGINPLYVSEKSRWLGMPEQRKRSYINNHCLLCKRDPDCDAVFVAAGLVAIIYKSYPNVEDRGPLDIYDDILAGKL